MLRIIVDSGSSIKQEEKDRYQVDILPIHVQMGEESFLDGVDLDINEFYERLGRTKEFPKTSLPSLEDAQNLAEHYTKAGDDVLFITISSEISGTYQALRMLFAENPKVTVFDSRLAVGGIRFLVEEARRYEQEPMEVIVDKLNRLIPRIVVAAIPETLDYLLAGGRLSRAEWMVGTLLAIKPVVGIQDGKVSVLAKKRGLKQSKNYIADLVKTEQCDPAYGIVASYTYDKKNIDEVVAMTAPEYREMITAYDNLIPSIACHWGPNAFGYIFVKSI
ncbi:MAG: DegV family protein [Lachnospiraceae bacterium]|nr:DegV family protein [Lachnospiraceae bacterium]MDD7148871.1 DegV family protein [Lachnospiraceae bacterium]MDY4069956.1 DegV family protein [Lachnospiraceae bacterium]